MCQILFSHKENPPVEVINFANDGNRDGFGYAYSVDGKVVFEKGFTEKQLTTEFVDMYFALPFPKAIHFRLATHGGVTGELTHPFPLKRGVPLVLKGNADSVLFHNGVWNDWDDRLRDGILAGTLNPNILKSQMSDSRAMAILAQRFGTEILDVLSLGTNKVLILQGDTWIKYGNWTDRKGWCASSSRVEPPRPKVVTEGENEGMVGQDGRWYSSGKGQKQRWKYRVCDGNGKPLQKSMYLDATRDEIEEAQANWGTHLNG